MAIDPNDPRVREFLREEEEKKPGRSHKPKPEKAPAGEEPVKSAENSVKRPFQKTRANVPLSRAEVRAIKKGRRKLRRELRQRGIRTRREFELTAGTLGLYFDKNRSLAAWFRLHWLGTLLGMLVAMLGVVLLFALIVQVRGYFTINLSRGMFREGFTLSETSGFEYPTTQLLAIPAEGVPCISINQIPAEVDDTDGAHNENYMAYTFYIRNEGENTVSYNWRLCMSAESLNASDAVWSILFVDGVPRLYAKSAKTGSVQALPAYGDDSRGFTRVPVLTANDSDQIHLIVSRGGVDYYRIVPDSFPSDDTMAEGRHDGVVPGEIHKYTVVLWIEGDDPECTDDLIGAYLGARMDFQLAGQDYDDTESSGLGNRLHDLWEGLRYYRKK